MSEHRPDEHAQDPELDAFVAEAIGALDREMGSRAVARSFGDVLVRAHRLDQQRVPASALEEERRLRQVIELRPHRESAEVAVSERALDDLITDARIALETEIGEARPSEARLQPPMPRHNRGRWIGLAAGLAMAAAVMLVAINVTTSSLQERTEPRNQAFSISDVEQKAEKSLERRPAPRVPAEPAPEPEAVEEEPEAQEPRARSKPAPPSLHDRLRVLDDKAQELWRAGSVDAAERTFEQLIELADGDRYAELAYADLFTIAHRKGDTVRQAKLWREYLGGFPAGRYADDARAGLCRQASGDAKAACWADYLQKMPRGSYRDEATRMIGEGNDADR
jgi:hypothetical protein